MLKKHSELMMAGLRLVDLVIVAAVWMAAYFLAFHAGVIPLRLGPLKPGMRAPVGIYLRALLFILPVAAVVFHQRKLYVPRRVSRLFEEAGAILMAVIITAVVCIALGGAFRIVETLPDGTTIEKPYILIYSRAVMASASVLCVVALTLERVAVRSILRRLRSSGWNARHVLIVGSGRLGQKLVERIKGNPWTGLQPVGYLDDRPERQGKSYLDVPVIGRIDDLPALLEKGGIDQLFVALPFTESVRAEKALSLAGDAMVDVRFVPDFYSFVTLNADFGDFDGLPVISLRQTPLAGWNLVLKRALDVVVASVALVLLAIPMLVLAVIIKLTSPGPVFYRQERMGMDGKLFKILKFRSMRVDAERDGAKRTTEDDPRRTRLGTFMRRTNIDELPQLVNVLAGDMSFVGPRPERPVFIKDLKKRFPGYMLRHKIKAGMTGWAQINGWRGDTSLEKRLQYDLYYIEHWSIWFDLYVTLMTPIRAFRNAY